MIFNNILILTNLTFFTMRSLYLDYAFAYLIIALLSICCASMLRSILWMTGNRYSAGAATFAVIIAPITTAIALVKGLFKGKRHVAIKKPTMGNDGGVFAVLRPKNYYIKLPLGIAGLLVLFLPQSNLLFVPLLKTVLVIPTTMITQENALLTYRAARDGFGVDLYRTDLSSVLSFGAPSVLFTTTLALSKKTL
jgi:hypothetical protein